MKNRLLLATLLCIVPLCGRAQTADDIVKKAIEARGGLAKIKAVQSERISGRISLLQGVEGTVVLELQRPHKLHSEITVGGQKIFRVFDGKSSGWMVNPFADNKDAQPMSEEELKEMPEEADLDGPLVDYKAKGTQIELVGKEDLEGKAVFRLKLTNQNGDTRSYLIDAATFLTAKWEGIRKIAEQALPWESKLSDYREVEGLKFPFKIDQGSPGTQYQQTLTIEKIEVNPKIEESHFAKPVPAEAPAIPTTPTPPAPQNDLAGTSNNTAKQQR
jgi:outer membrane lipoprotein-sorting protein